jgi:2-methylcitrate dehydratase PrpD
LAQLGAFAAPSILEGEAGLFRAVGRTDPPSEIALFPDGDHVISSVFHKQAPACNYAQTPCQAAVHTARKYSGSLDDIRTITVRITDAARRYPGCDYVGPFLNVLQAKMSIQYGVATAIAAGGVSEANYARIGEAEIERLIDLIQLVVAPDLTAAYPAKQGAGVEIVTKDGGKFDATLGDIETAGANEIQTRFDRSAANWLGRDPANTLVDFVSEIDNCDDVRALNTLCISST